MSENCRFYVAKMAERIARRSAPGSLCHQLDVLLSVVQWCEAMWALEDRIEQPR